jgi:hypothetical protein
MNIFAGADVRSYKAFGIGNKMEMSIDKARNNCLPAAVDNGGIIILMIFPIFSLSGCDDFLFLDNCPGSPRTKRI